MPKDFDIWNDEKKRVDMDAPCPLFYEREVWWCALGINVGVETDGKHEKFLRPVLMIRKFNAQMALIMPLTTKDKAGNKYYRELKGEDGKEYVVCLSQIRAISARRLSRKIGMVTTRDYEAMLEVAAKMILKGL